MTIQESIDRVDENSQRVGRLEGYGNVSHAIGQLVHTEIARGMPNGDGYAQALNDLLTRMAELVHADKP